MIDACILLLTLKGTNANVFIKLHDEKGHVSEPIELDRSIRHRNKFERGQTDEFEVGSYSTQQCHRPELH